MANFVMMKIEIGKVLKAQGVKGEVKISCYLDNPKMLLGIKQLYIGSNTYAVQKIRCDSAFGYVLLQGIADRNAAEGLRNWAVYADKESLTVPTNRYFIDDLVGCTVLLDDGKTVGVIKEVLQYGSADVFVCANGEKEVSFPFLNDLVLEVNVERKAVVVKSGRFGEVAVYED